MESAVDASRVALLEQVSHTAELINRKCLPCCAVADRSRQVGKVEGRIDDIVVIGALIEVD